MRPNTNAASVPHPFSCRTTTTALESLRCIIISLKNTNSVNIHPPSALTFFCAIQKTTPWTSRRVVLVWCQRRLATNGTSSVCLPLQDESLHVFPNCKSLWIKASATWLNVNAKQRKQMTEAELWILLWTTEGLRVKETEIQRFKKKGINACYLLMFPMFSVNSCSPNVL